ncbi:MAG: hypothetical protein EGP14_01980 [SAR202 cluster bacterium]|jgi:hypothetical protein|nr:MAG: hypothetical protein EGP14_01980 [SAR202 cluster bacterium]
MNLCVNSTFSCSVAEFNEAFSKFEDEMNKFASDFKVGVVNDNEVIIMLNVTDFEAMETFMTSPEITQWNEENNNVDILYSIERMD